VADLPVAIPRLTTGRLALRAFRDDDREPFAALNADPAVMEFFPARLTRAESDAFVDRILARWATDGHGLWAVERLEDGAFLGFTGLARLDWLDQPEVGWRFARSAWGHGYATEAADASLAWGFATLGLAEIVSVTTVANLRSRAVMERIGMTRDPADDFLHPNLPDGHPLRPHVLYRIRREDREAASRA
jgi:ribosomal-protein-alanine N-acetyltransferase